MEENKDIQPERPTENSSEVPQSKTSLAVDKTPLPPEHTLPMEDVFPSKKSETESINPTEAKDMEVHHHSHPRHHKKKWKDYFWEFLMLFLAVFCGFLAEYQLEHKIEKDRAEKYMHDMVENLKYDTTRVALNVPLNRETKKDLDSFRYEIKNAISGQVNTNLLYYFSLKINDYNLVAFNKSAITQLKNSGQLRLVKNDALVNEMLDYYERKVYAAEVYQENAQKAFEDFAQALNNVFSTTPFDFIATASDSTYSQQMEDDYKQNISSVLKDQSLQLLNGDKATLEKLFTAVGNFEWSLINYNKFLNFSRQGAEKLMIHIEDLY
ncbi:MAG: hypothetical protein ABIP80_00505 [Ferruginibacter sp.]